MEVDSNRTVLAREMRWVTRSGLRYNTVGLDTFAYLLTMGIISTVLLTPFASMVLALSMETVP